MFLTNGPELKKNQTDGRTEEAWLQDGVGQEADHGVQTFDLSGYCVHGGVSAQNHVQLRPSKALNRRAEDYLDVWQSQIPPCFSSVRRISSLLPYCAVD